MGVKETGSETVKQRQSAIVVFCDDDKLAGCIRTGNSLNN
jgi:hypothetical protein